MTDTWWGTSLQEMLPTRTQNAQDCGMMIIIIIVIIIILHSPKKVYWSELPQLLLKKSTLEILSAEDRKIS